MRLHLYRTVVGVKGPSYEEDSSHAMPPWMAQILPTVSGGGGGGSIHSSAEASSSAGAGNSAAHFYLQQQAFQNGSYQSSGQPARFDAAAYNPPPPHNSAAAAYSISSQPNGATFSQFRAAVPVASSRSNSGGVHRSSSGDGDGFNRNTSLEMLNTIAQLGSSTSSLEHLTDANALKQQQLQHQHRMHAFAPSASDPTRDVFPALAMNTNSSTFTLGDSVGWPSFGNLNSLNGGSMDDLLSAGLLSRQVRAVLGRNLCLIFLLTFLSIHVVGEWRHSEGPRWPSRRRRRTRGLLLGGLQPGQRRRRRGAGAGESADRGHGRHGQRPPRGCGKERLAQHRQQQWCQEKQQSQR